MALDKLLSGMNKSGMTSGLAGGMASGALVSALLNKKGRKHLGTVAKVGGVAALGGLAWKAYQSYQASNQTATAGGAVPAQQTTASPANRATHNAGSPALEHDRDANNWTSLNHSAFDVEASDNAGDSRGLLLVRAMIAAAHSDGEIDMDEQARIFNKAAQEQLSTAEKAMVLDELQHPKSMQDIVTMVTCNEAAVEVYLASMLAIDETRPEGANYLNALAFMLGLPPALVTELQRQAVA